MAWNLELDCDLFTDLGASVDKIPTDPKAAKLHSATGHSYQVKIRITVPFLERGSHRSLAGWTVSRYGLLGPTVHPQGYRHSSYIRE